MTKWRIYGEKPATTTTTAHFESLSYTLNIKECFLFKRNIIIQTFMKEIPVFRFNFCGRKTKLNLALNQIYDFSFYFAKEIQIFFFCW